MKRLSILFLTAILCLMPIWGWGATETFYLTATGAGTKSGTSLANAMSPTEFNNGANWDTDDQDDDKIGPNDDVEVYDDHGVIRAQLTIQKSGLSGKPITIKAGSGGTVYLEMTVSGVDNYGGCTKAFPVIFKTDIYADISGTGASYIIEYVILH
jgi:hypothetical protein